MNEQQVQLADGTKLEAWRCGVCGIIYGERDPMTSAWCCKCKDCGATVDPKVTGSRSSICEKCWGPHYAKIDADRLDKATELTGYTGSVFYNDAYFHNVEDVIEHCECRDVPVPEFVHATTTQQFSLDVDDVLNSAIEQMSVEDLGVADLDGVPELREAVTRFNEANKGRDFYWEDTSKKVRVREVGTHV